MTTTTVPIEITCPDWCTETPELHVADLWEIEGNSIHWTPTTYIEDQAGLVVEALSPRLHCRTARVCLSVTTRPDGRESSSPVVIFNDNEMSLEQAEEVAAAITAQIATYRAWQSEQQR